MALKSGMTLVVHDLPLFPQVFETFSKALHGLERKMNYLKSMVKTPV
jgi:hypothetical protein